MADQARPSGVHGTVSVPLSEVVALLALGGGLLATAMASAWRMSAIVSQQRELLSYAREENEEQDDRLRELFAEVSRLKSRVAVLESRK